MHDHPAVSDDGGGRNRAGYSGRQPPVPAIGGDA